MRSSAVGLPVGELLHLLEVLPPGGGFLLVADLGELLVDLLVLGWRRHPPDAKPRAGLVDEVDRLVRQEAVRDVAVGEVGGGDERLVGDRHLVVLLVPVAQAPQDLDRVREGRLFDLDRLEAPLEGGVLFEVLAVLVERRRADRLQLAAGEHRLQDRGGVDRALGRAGADEGVQLVDEQDDVAAGADLLQHLLQALLEVTAVAAAGHERAEVEGVELLALQGLGDVVLDDLLRQPLDDGRLADAGLADEHGVVLRAAGEHLHHALDLAVATDDRVELVVPGELGEVAPELVEHRRSGRALGARGPGRDGGSLAALVAREQLDDLLADAGQVGAEADEDLGGDALALADETEQHVLGADVVVAELQRLSQRELEDLLRPRRERRRAGRGRPGGTDRLLDLLAYGLERDAEGLERLRGESLALVDEAEQDVLGPDEAVVQKARFLLSQDQHPACPIGESLEQLRLPCGLPLGGSLPVRMRKVPPPGQRTLILSIGPCRLQP